MRRRHAPIFALVLLFAPAVAAQADPGDDRIRAEMKRQNIPGLSLAVVKNGEVVKAEGYGLANIKLKTPATPATVYKIASVSKQFIATGIMLMNLDDVDIDASIETVASMYLPARAPAAN